MPKIVRVLLVCILALIGISVWGAVAPSHLNWGVHLFAFFSFPVQLCFLALSLILLIPRVTAGMISGIESIVSRVSKLPLTLSFLITAGVCITAWLLYPVKLHLLGDGAILLRSVSGAEHLILPVGFRNQPLVWMLYKAGRVILSVLMTPTPGDVYYLIDIVSGAALVGLIFWWGRRLERPNLEKILLGSIVLFCGGFQFFFGYIENYATQYVFTFAFIVAGWYSLEKKVHILVPTIIFVFLVALNLGSLIFVPAVVFIFIHRMNRHKFRGLLIIGIAGVIGVILMALIGFNVGYYITHFLSGSPDFLPILSVHSGYFPYPMFSLLHLIDWLNLQALIFPLGLILPVLILVFYRNEIGWKNPVLLFLLIAAGCGIAFTWIVNSALGVARDWDLFASFFVPLVVLSVYLLQLPFKFEGRRSVMAVAAVITLLHTIPFIGINGDEEKQLERVEMLNDVKLLSVTSRIFYYEALANRYYDAGGYEKAREYYEQYARYDSVNPRILANMTETYRKLGMKDAYFRVLKRTVSLGNPNPAVFINLGVVYAERGDTAKAIEMNLKGLRMDSTQIQAHTNLAVLYLNTNKPAAAVSHAAGAIALGTDDPMIYRIQAKAYVMMKDYVDAVRVYDEYLLLVPGDSYVRGIRDRMNADLSLQK